MLRIEKTLASNQALAPALLRRAAVLTLPYDQRCRSRLAVTLDDGRDAALFLPRGTILRDGAVLVATDGTLVRVAAASQPVLRVTGASALALLRAAYHLGNRHIPVQVHGDWLQLEHDPVLRDMLLRLGGVQVEDVEAAFDPESGAYGGGHRHGHDETFAEDHALAQDVYTQRHGHEARPAHEHAHDHGHHQGHEHAHSHEHEQAREHDHGNCHGHDHEHHHDDAGHGRHQH